MNDDLDSAEHSTETDEGKDYKISDKSKRGRLKDAIHRTKSKIADKVREEKEARRIALHSDKGKSASQLDDGVDAFLAAGRVSTASSTNPSIYSKTASSENISTTNGSSSPPRPSTSDSKTNPSPRRIVVPRIDVSGSQRFPNAKELGNNGPAELPGSSALSSASVGSSSLLKPEFKSRSLSTSSIASAERKKRIRGLSVGFADAPPVIIGEGGDEAEAPPVEISRAKMRRARSASPQARSPYPGAGAHHEMKGSMAERGFRDSPTDAFAPQFPRPTQTNKPLDMTRSNANAVSATGYDDFVPKPLGRTQTGFTDVHGVVASERLPALPPRPKPEFLPYDLGRPKQGTMDLTREFEMSLGLKPSSPATEKPPTNQEPRIFAPKPQRAPPSYDLIESGKNEPGVDLETKLPAQVVEQQDPQQQVSNVVPQQHGRPVEPVSLPNVSHQRPPMVAPQKSQSNQQQFIPPEPRHDQNAPYRKPVHQATYDQSPPANVNSQGSEYFYRSPMPQSQTSTTSISRFASLHSTASRTLDHPSRQQSLAQQQPVNLPGELPASSARVLSPIVTSHDQPAYRSFADRSKHSSHPLNLVDSPASKSPNSANVRRVSPSAPYETSPSNFSSAVASPHSGGEPSATKPRFYESINQGKPPTGFI